MLVVAGDVAVDDLRVDLEDVVISDPQTLRVATLEVVHHHVGDGRHFQQNLACFGAFQIQRHRALVAIDAVVVRRFGIANLDAPITRIVAAQWVFNLDHVRPHVAQHLGAQRAGKHTCQIENSDSG
ncbi:hypothetical protein SDC9_207947 [bioreactor metagenome]|uniref:Uncharacterized protein n=1 Tax=bioreactor metagenome TaxID=1076179 RepID=A0A645JAS4_9ZZZZ